MVESAAGFDSARRRTSVVDSRGAHWRLFIAGFVIIAAAVSVLGNSPQAGAATGQMSAEQRPPFHPSRLTHLGDAGQVVVVTSRSWSSTHAVLRRYVREPDRSWTRRGHAVKARLGRHGFVRAAERRQSTGTTPAGTFAVVSAFGNGPDPGTVLPYRQADRSDWWVYDPRDPATYNILQPRRVPAARWRTSWAEDLSGYGEQYRFVAVLDFNLPHGVHRTADGQRVAAQPANTRLGGGIFLHVHGPGATAGCVTVRRATMRRTLRWLDPARHPVVVMGPRSAIDRL